MNTKHNGGSLWHDYDVWSVGYDKYRRPIGIAEMVEKTRHVAARAGKPLHEVAFGAFCCGTGSNESAILRMVEKSRERFATLHAFDFSTGMLKNAGPKLSGTATPVNMAQLDVVEGDAPVPDQSLDVATLIQAIQHLDHNDPKFPRLQKALKRIRSKIARNGVLIMVTSSPEQGYHSRWYAHLCKGRFDSPEKDPAFLHSRAWPPFHLLMEQLKSAGFEIEERKNLGGPYIDPEAYNGPAEMVFDPGFRAAVSFFGLAEKHGLIPEYDRVARHLIDSGEIKKVRSESERIRQRCGTAYLLTARPV